MSRSTESFNGGREDMGAMLLRLMSAADIRSGCCARIEAALRTVSRMLLDRMEGYVRPKELAVHRI